VGYQIRGNDRIQNKLFGRMQGQHCSAHSAACDLEMLLSSAPSNLPESA
jgi:hypothetical protein